MNGAEMLEKAALHPGAKWTRQCWTPVQYVYFTVPGDGGGALRIYSDGYDEIAKLSVFDILAMDWEYIGSLDTSIVPGVPRCLLTQASDALLAARNHLKGDGSSMEKTAAGDLASKAMVAIQELLSKDTSESS